MRRERVSSACNSGACGFASSGLRPNWLHAAANVAVARKQAVAHPFMSIRSPKEPGFSDVQGQLLLWSLPVGDYGGSGYMLPLLPELLPPLY